ncbi:ADP-heptose:LPS heptosyltransferase [Gilliamella bombicola]|uniref:ADP-heptose:LPS heptosyltransferase n=1 Tax=Gilliamella bombicola TaxID=1798182 RepID=A0A1C4A0S6_9GAMM|nr:ADP-heptose:LPS heptosyltransferase [Gilliamella bombicola]
MGFRCWLYNKTGINLYKSKNKDKKFNQFKRQLFLIKLIFDWNIRKKIKLNKVKKILLLRQDRIGDMIITTPLIRNLHNNGYKVSVISTKDSIEFIKSNPHIDKTFVWDWSWNYVELFKKILLIRKEKFDLAIDLREQLEPKTILFNILTGSKRLVGFNKSNFFSFDVSINYNNPKNHITMKMKEIMDSVFNLNYDSLEYDAFVSKMIDEKGKNYIDNLRKNNKKIVVINPFASLRERDMSLEQLADITKTLQFDYNNLEVVLIGEQSLLNTIPDTAGIHKYSSHSILDVIPIIKYCDLVISVDTAAVHLASAFNKKIVGLYGLFFWDVRFQKLKWQYFNSSALPKNFKIENYLHFNEYAWSPKTSNKSIQIFSQQGELINTIPPRLIIEGIKNILN